MKPHEMTDALERIAREAGDELRRRFGGPRIVQKKGDIDLVTDADRAAEAIVLAGLAAAFPGAAVLAEESGAQEGRPGLLLLVDPLDGTTNYAHGIPHFAVSLAAADDQGVVAAVVHDPMREETYRASRGGGAFCNGERLGVSEAALDDAVLASGFPYDLRSRTDDLPGLFGRVLLGARAVRRFGSAALDLAWVAQGRFDGYWERGLKPWDFAAGLLLVQEAGGRVTDFAGAPARLAGDEVVAASGILLPELLAHTRPLAQSASA